MLVDGGLHQRELHVRVLTDLFVEISLARAAPSPYLLGCFNHAGPTVALHGYMSLALHMDQALHDSPQATCGARHRGPGKTLDYRGADSAAMQIGNFDRTKLAHTVEPNPLSPDAPPGQISIKPMRPRHEAIKGSPASGKRALGQMWANGKPAPTGSEPS